MLSFKSILFAAAAFASLVSAIPTPETGSGLTNIVQRTPVDESFAITGLLPEDGVAEEVGPNGADADVTTRDLSKRGGPSFGERIKQCHDDIAVIVVKITAAVKVEGGAKAVDCGLVTTLLWKIVDLLKGLLYDLKLIIKAEIILGCTLKELAGIVAELLILIIEVVYLVLFTVGFLEDALCEVIVAIGGLLCEILGVVFGLVEGLLVLVVELIVPYGDHCKFIKYTEILVILGIKF